MAKIYTTAFFPLDWHNNSTITQKEATFTSRYVTIISLKIYSMEPIHINPLEHFYCAITTFSKTLRIRQKLVWDLH